MFASQIHKRINFNFEKQKLIFDTSQELFSFAKVDEGTKELLDSLRKNSFLNYQKILDLGCGYGALGIFLKKKFKESEIICSDRDSLAIEFTQHNAELNSVEIKAISSLDFQNITGKFSLIITNFPAKLEKEGLEYFISRSSEFLEKEGALVLVIVKELDEAMQEILKNEKIICSFKEKKKNYCIYHLKFTEEINAEVEPYTQNEISFDVDGSIYSLETSNALQEFDTPHFITQLLVEKILDPRFNNLKTITILNPNQGFLSVAVTRPCSRDKIILASRDLLQLKLSAENLKLNKVDYFEALNTDFPQNKGDLLIWSLCDESMGEILEKLIVFRKNFEKIIIGGRTQILKRIVQSLKIDSKKEMRQGKYSLLEL